uniref:Uncharacterized protein n=1 Tax=Chaetoceros debilis TaxID=122233 RepID=A0A7S3QF70_9STRA
MCDTVEPMATTEEPSPAPTTAPIDTEDPPMLISIVPITNDPCPYRASETFTPCGEPSRCNVRPNLLIATGGNLDKYYATTDGLTGAKLKTELNSIIRGHRQMSYGCVWTALAQVHKDKNNDDNLIEFYTRRSVSRLRRDCGSGKNDGNCWNCKHLWTKSKGFSKQGQDAYTDIHHRVSSDKSVNGARINHSFMNGGTPEQECCLCKQGDNFTWEAPDSVKGQIARMVFYMDVRYDGGDGDGDGTGDLELVDRGTAKDNHLGYLSDLLT